MSTTNSTIPYLPSLPRIDHTNIEYDTVRADIQNYIFNQFPSNWNFFLESNAGQMMLELFSYFADQLGFRIDAAANETYLPTAQHRESILKLLQLIDYQMLPIQQASLSLTALRSDAETTQVYDVLINDTDKNIRTVLTGLNKDNESINYTVLAGKFDYDTKVVLPRPKDYVNGVLSDTNPTTTSILAYEGNVREQIIDDITGEDNQVYVLRYSPVIFGSVKAYIDKGEGWETISNNQYLVNISTEQSSNFLNPVYRQEWNSDGQCKIMFGEAKYGPKPEIGHRLRFVYMTGVGTKGNIGRNGINQSLSCNIIDWQGRITDSTRILFNNASNPSFGGRDQESIQEARTFAPLLLRTAWKANSREDHNILITGQPSVRLAKAASDDENDLIANYTTMLYIVPNSTETISDYYQLDYTIQQAIEEYMNGDEDSVSHKIIGLDNVVVPAHILEMDITINMIKKRFYDENVIKTQILNVFKEYFDPYLEDGVKNNDFDFGREINIQDFELKIKQIQGVDSVTSIDINFVNPLEDLDGNGNDITLPVYPNHEEIVLQSKRKAQDATIEILYELANYNTYEDLGNEYLQNVADEASLQNFDSNYNCYSKLANTKKAVNFFGRETTMANCWLRFAYNKADKFSFRTKIYSGSNPVFSNGTLSQLALPAIVKNSQDKTTITCSTICISGDTYSSTIGQSIIGRTLLATINEIEVKVTIPDGTADTPEGFVAALNSAMSTHDNYSSALLQAFVTIDRKIGFYSNYSVTVSTSTDKYPTTVSINTVIGLSEGIYTAATSTNYLPCASDVLLKEGENTLLFRINGKEEKVTLSTSVPTTYSVNQFDKSNVGLGADFETFDYPVIFSTYPNVYDWNSDNNQWQLNQDLVITNEVADDSSTASITKLYIRISKTSNSYYLIKQPEISYNGSTYKHFDSGNSSEIANWSAGTVYTDPGLYQKGVAASAPATGTTQQYYYVSHTSDDAWTELDCEDFGTYPAVSKLQNLYVWSMNAPVSGATEADSSLVNKFIWNFSKENILDNENGFETNKTYFIEVKARKDYNLQSGTKTPVDSTILSRKISFTAEKDEMFVEFCDTTTETLTGSVTTRMDDARIIWMDNDYLLEQQSDAEINFYILDVDYDNTDASATVSYTSEIVTEDKQTSLITLPTSNVVVSTTPYAKMSNMTVDLDDTYGYVTGIPSGTGLTLDWNILYRLPADFHDETASGSITFSSVGLVEGLYLIQITEIVDKINDDATMSRYFRAILSDDGQQICLISKAKELLPISISYDVFSLLNITIESFDRMNVLTINRSDLYDGDNEILQKTNLYYVKISALNLITNETSIIYVPMYYYKTYDYDGAMNREKLRDEIFAQIPNINSQSQTIITPQTFEIPILNENKFVVNVS